MMRYYRPISLAGALGFAAAGLLFLLRPEQAIAYFNRQAGLNFYVVLAVGYMYLVALLAMAMFLHPRERVYPLLLAHGKLASAVLSLYVFFTGLRALIFLANGVVDGVIGLVALYFYRELRKA